MRSQWIELKETATELRRAGQSLKTIHQNIGVPLSTLSGWLKDIELSEDQRNKLQKNKKIAWKHAQQKAADWHRTQKVLRTLEAKREAERVLEEIDMSQPTLELILATLLFGDSQRKETTPISSSNPKILRFILKTLQLSYGIEPTSLRYHLNLRADQDSERAKAYWSSELRLSSHQLMSVVVDKRNRDNPTHETYNGVCVLNFRSVAIQRKLRYLYDLFCERITKLDEGT